MTRTTTKTTSKTNTSTTTASAAAAATADSSSRAKKGAVTSNAASSISRANPSNIFRVKLEHNGFADFGVGPSRSAFSVAARTGRYSVKALREAAERSRDGVALPVFNGASCDAWECRALGIYGNIAAREGVSTIAGGNAVLTQGFVQMARESLVAVARTEAQTEGDIFMKLVLASDLDRAEHIPSRAELAGLLRQMVQADLATLGLNAAAFHARADRALRRSA